MILDRDLAAIYCFNTGRLNEAVKRNVHLINGIVVDVGVEIEVIIQPDPGSLQFFFYHRARPMSSLTHPIRGGVEPPPI